MIRLKNHVKHNLTYLLMLSFIICIKYCIQLFENQVNTFSLAQVQVLVCTLCVILNENIIMKNKVCSTNVTLKLKIGSYYDDDKPVKIW